MTAKTEDSAWVLAPDCNQHLKFRKRVKNSIGLESEEDKVITFLEEVALNDI